MLRVESNTKLEGFTEFEEDILFDEDDPDFQAVPLMLGAHVVTSPLKVTEFSRFPSLFQVGRKTKSSVLKLRKNMSLASVHPAGLHSNHSSLAHSLDDLREGPQVLTIEELRLQMTTCFTCGVSWSDSHVSLDCAECGGYALERPCPECEGGCGAVWKRDLSMSHASSKARWQGKCEKKDKGTNS